MYTVKVTLEFRSESMSEQEMLAAFKGILESHEESLADSFDGADNADPTLECSIDGKNWWVLDAAEKDDEDEDDDNDKAATMANMMAAINALPKEQRRETLETLKSICARRGNLRVELDDDREILLVRFPNEESTQE